MIRKIRNLAAGVVLILVFIGCTPGDRYEKLVAAELARGIRVDTLFLDLRLGMTDKQFYTHCWELNKKGLIRQGTSNTSVLYKMKELNEPAEMNFYPNFFEGKIYEMPVKYNYEGWAPWNQHLSSDSLQLEILNRYKEWYGDNFIEVRHPKRGMAYIKVDGNRRITIFKEDERHVWAIFTDLLVEKEVKALLEQEKNKDQKDEKQKNPIEEALGISE